MPYGKEFKKEFHDCKLTVFVAEPVPIRNISHMIAVLQHKDYKTLGFKQGAITPEVTTHSGDNWLILLAAELREQIMIKEGQGG